MPQSLNQKAVNNFIKGLITEAAELTFPEGASVDELNCDLRRDGTRRRRLGVAYEDSYGLSSFTLSDSDNLSAGSWINVGGNPELEFLVIQAGATLYFYNKADLPYSEQQHADSIDLSTYEYAGSAGAENAKCSFASIKGTLVISSEAIDTIYVEYDTATDTIGTPQTIDFKVRDFKYLGDTEDYKTKSATSTVSDERIYDTLNSGWADENNGRAGQTSLAYYRSQQSSLFPPLTHPWFSGKNASDAFDVAEWEKVGAGTSLSGNGRYVLDFFNKDRDSIVTDQGFTAPSPSINETETSRFRCVESFGGRVFYAGLDSDANSGTVLFTNLIESVNDLGKCHQINDPTSEYQSELLATDGGEVKIPDAINIKKLYAYQFSLFVFADNGVWQITGADGQFRADAYIINRVSRVGLLSAGSFVFAEGLPFWWSRFGIHTLETDTVSGQATEKNISINTIQSFWDEIDTDAKKKVVSVYDNISKRIYWGYPDAGESVQTKINNFLLFDVPITAFFPWKVEDQASNTNAIVGLSFYSGFGAKQLELNVTASSGADEVVVGADDVVSTQISSFNTGDPTIVLICRDGATNKITMGGFSSTGFLDWGETNYISYAVTGYDFIGDLVRKKNSPYLITYARLTEEGFTGNEEAGFEAIRPSSLLVSSAWDFNQTFGTPQQAYRLKYPVIVNPSDLTEYNYPESVITTRLKIRGHGRSVRIKYESEQGKDFLILGWGMIQGANPRF